MQSNFFISQFKRITNSSTENINIIIYVLIFVLSLDTLLNQTGDLIGDPLKSSAGIVLFITLSLITLVAQILVLQFVGKNSAEIQRKIKSIRLLHRSVTIIQYIIIGIFVFLIFEIVLKQNYLPVSSMLVTFLSYMQTTILMALFTFIFLSWYKTNHNSVLVLLYGLSFATVVIASFAILIVFLHQFSDKLFIPIISTSPGTFLSTEEGTIWKIFAKTYQFSDMASFFLKWAGTALMLYHYAQKIGHAKYWFLLSLPLLYFSMLIIYHLHIYEPHEELEQLIFYSIIALNSTFGGILFYIAFKLTVKNLKSNKLFKSYLIMAGYGFMLFFSGTQSVLTNTGYPPFGFSTVSSYGLGSYLILMGLYLSAKSISRDEQLKEIVKNSTLAESKFLHSIGMSESEREKKLLKDVLVRTKEQQENIKK
ncbi:MAG: hypothetical protein ACPKQO_04920, partial [Nitrososphaeraceae archaeon]